MSGIWKSVSLPALDNLVVKTDYTGTGTLAGHTVNLTLSQVELMTVNYYDDHAFTGKVTQHQLVHSAPGKTTQTEVYAYDYGTPATNPTERLLAVTHKLNSAHHR